MNTPFTSLLFGVEQTPCDEKVLEGVCVGEQKLKNKAKHQELIGYLDKKEKVWHGQPKAQETLPLLLHTINTAPKIHLYEIFTVTFLLHLAMHLDYHLGQINYHRRLLNI